MRLFLIVSALLLNACVTDASKDLSIPKPDISDCDNLQAPSGTEPGAEAQLESERCLEPAARRAMERPGSLTGALPELSPEERAAVEKEAERLREDIRRSRKAREAEGSFSN